MATELFKRLLRKSLTESQFDITPPKKFTLISGENVGSEISTAVRKIFAAAEVPIE